LQSEIITQGVEDFVVLDEPYWLDTFASDVEVLANYDPRQVHLYSMFGTSVPEKER
jgi:hypothetical protein